MIVKSFIGVAFALSAPWSVAQEKLKVDVWGDAGGHSIYLGNMIAPCQPTDNSGASHCTVAGSDAVFTPSQEATGNGTTFETLKLALGHDSYLWAEMKGKSLSYWVRIKDCQIVEFGTGVAADDKPIRSRQCTQSAAGPFHFAVSMAAPKL